MLTCHCTSLLQEVALRLDLEELLLARLVCKAWTQNFLAEVKEVVLRVICYDAARCSAIKSLLQRLPSGKAIAIVWSATKHPQPQQLQELLQTIATATHLKELVLRLPHSWGLVERLANPLTSTLSTFTHLRSLCLQLSGSLKANDATTPEFTASILRSLTSLQQLNLAHVLLEAQHLSTLSALQRLASLTVAAAAAPAQLMAAVAPLTALRSLTCHIRPPPGSSSSRPAAASSSSATSEDQEGPAGPPVALPDLPQLTQLGYLKRGGGAALAPLQLSVQQCDTLRDLQLDGPLQLQQECVQLPAVTSLQLGSLVRDASLPSLPALQRLRYYSTSGACGDKLLPLLHESPQLQVSLLCLGLWLCQPYCCPAWVQHHQRTALKGASCCCQALSDSHG